MFEGALKINERTKGNQHCDIRWTLHELGLVNFKMNRIDLAVTFYQKAIENKRSNFGDQHYNMRWTYYNLGMVFKQMGDKSAALESLNQTLAIFIHFLGSDCMEAKEINQTIEEINNSP